MTLTYRGAGVDADEGNRLVERIKPHAARTMRPEVLAGIGGFGGLVKVPLERYREPVLVSGTDGVGTKLKVAFATGVHNTVGIDLVAMCVNDVIVSGAEPLYFLDYFATGKLDAGVAEQVIAGIAEGCVRAGCALIGGETAELPGFYAAGEYDLAGFAVGVVEQSRIIDGRRVQAGHRIVGIASSGIHSNGLSLARKVLLEKAALPFDAEVPGCGQTVRDELLRPTHIYAKLVAMLRQSVDVRGLAHITGGGLPGNLARMFPKGTAAVIDAKKWPVPPIFGAIQKLGPVAPEEMSATFNMGLGLCVVVPSNDVTRSIATARAAGFDAWEVGQVVGSSADEPTATVENLCVSDGRIAVLVSGSGSNLQAMIDASSKGELAGTLAVVVSNRPGVLALDRAAKAGIETLVLDHRQLADRAQYDAALDAALAARKVDWIVLAGFMRLLGAPFVTRWRGRLVNIHPSLLPAFPGAHALRDAVVAKAPRTGVTVHFVDEGTDTGPIIAQEGLDVRPAETEESLAARVHEIEHRLYPRVVDALVQGRIHLEGRTVVGSL